VDHSICSFRGALKTGNCFDKEKKVVILFL
jgi:hypothetical protein